MLNKRKWFRNHNFPANVGFLPEYSLYIPLSASRGHKINNCSHTSGRTTLQFSAELDTKMAHLLKIRNEKIVFFDHEMTQCTAELFIAVGEGLTAVFSWG